MVEATNNALLAEGSTDNLRGAAAVHWDDVVDVVLHEIARLLLENGGKDG
jgi:hypothetical protein